MSDIHKPSESRILIRVHDRHLSRLPARRPAHVAEHGEQLRARSRRARGVRREEGERGRGAGSPRSRSLRAATDDQRARAAVGRARDRVRPRLLPVPAAREAHHARIPPRICAPRGPGRRCPKYLDLAQVDRLLAQPDTGTPRGLRDKALIELLYATGLRVTELLSLKAGDVSLDAGYLTCIGKGDKQRIVPLGELGRGLGAALPLRRPAGAARRAQDALAVRQREGGRPAVARRVSGRCCGTTASRPGSLAD